VKYMKLHYRLQVLNRQLIFNAFLRFTHFALSLPFSISVKCEKGMPLGLGYDTGNFRFSY